MKLLEKRLYIHEKKVPRDGLEIDPENIHSVKYSFEGCPVVKLILKTKLDQYLWVTKKPLKSLETIVFPNNTLSFNGTQTDNFEIYPSNF